MRRLSPTSTALASMTALLAAVLAIPPASAAVSHVPQLTPAATHATGGTSGVVAYFRSIGARYVRPASFRSLTVDVATPMRNAAGLRQYAQSASDPKSMYYRHFLSPEQIADSFATPAVDYARTVARFKSEGLTVHAWRQRSLLTVSGSSTALTRAFGTQFGLYQIRNRVTGRLGSFVSASTASTLSPSIGSVSVLRMTTLVTRTRNDFIGGPAIPVSGSFSNARVNGATPLELGQAYDYAGAYAAGFTGKGVNLGIIGTGPITQGTSAANDDALAYRKTFNVPGSGAVKIVPASVNGDSAPPPVTGPANCAGSLSGTGLPLPINDPTAGSGTAPTATCNDEDIEAQLDTEQTSMLAYDANVLFYLAYNAANDEQGIVLADDEIAQAVNDNQTDILSLSYGECELLAIAPELNTNALTGVAGADATGVDPTMFQELATEGVAVFVSSGDTGSAGCQREPGNEDNPNASYPGSDPNVVSVGGTTTPMLPTGKLSGPITNWGSQTKSGGASGAGASGLFVEPSFQSNVPAVATACAAAATTTDAAASVPPTSATLATNRCEPDVALDGDPFTGAAVIFNTGLNGGGEMEEPVGGTSQAAPDMAAMWALVLSACEVTPSCGGGTFGVTDPATPPFAPTSAAPHKFRLGNPNFLWYPLAAAGNTKYHQVFYDIVFGDDAVPPYALQVASSEAGGEGANVSSYTALDTGSVTAGPGYDVASGLGSPFARALIRYVVGV